MNTILKYDFNILIDFVVNFCLLHNLYYCFVVRGIAGVGGTGVRTRDFKSLNQSCYILCYGMLLAINDTNRNFIGLLVRGVAGVDGMIA